MTYWPTWRTHQQATVARREPGAEPSGKGGGGTFSSKAGSAGATSQPTGSMKGGGMTSKGNAKKL